MPAKTENPVWGIEIKLEYVEPYLTAKFYIENGKRSNYSPGLFVTNAEIRESILKFLKLPPKLSVFLGSNYVGHAALKVDAAKKTAYWSDYHPITGHMMDIFLHKGIAQLLEHQMLAQLNKEFPMIKRIEHEHPSELRLTQLWKRKLYKRYSLQEGLQALKRKIGRDTKKHRLRK